MVIKTKFVSGMVTAMDEAVGKVVTALKDTGHYNNSIIVFTTDVSNYCMLCSGHYHHDRACNGSHFLSLSVVISWSLCSVCIICLISNSKFTALSVPQIILLSSEWWPHCECWQQLATTGEQVNTVGGRNPWPSLCSLTPSPKPWKHFKWVSSYIIMHI